MEHYTSLFKRILLSFFLTLITVSANPNILIEGFDGVFWPNISDNDLNPNQQVTDFDSVFCNESSDRRYRISNTGSQTLTIFNNASSPSSTSSQFTFPDFPSGNFTIAPGGVREFLIRYTPVTTSRTTTIRIDSNDPDAENVYTFAVTGEGRCGEASVNFDPDSGSDVVITDGDTTPSTSSGTNFGSVSVGSSVTHDFFIHNSLTADDVLRIRNPRLLGAGASSFQILSLGTSNLGIGNNRNFDIRFAPTSAGIKTATFIFDNNDVNEDPYSFTITGVATAFPEISVEGRPTGQVFTNFDSIGDGQSSPNREDGTLVDSTSVGDFTETVIRINNTGSAALTLGNRSITGTGSSHFGTVGYSTASIPAGDSREFRLRFTPLSSGTHTATFSFANNDLNESPFNFTIRGVATAPEIRIAGRPTPGSGGFDNIIDGQTTVSAAEGTDFGLVRVAGGENESEFSINNDGSEGLNISNARITGANAYDFQISSLSTFTNIGAGNDRDFIITFNPGSTGVKTATFIIDNNDPNENPYSFSLRGQGFGFPDLRVRGRRNTIGNFLTEIFDNDVTPRSADGTLFNDTEVGETTEMLVELSNDGDGALDFTATPSITGPDADQFSFVGLNANDLLPGASRTFVVRFAPTSFGTKNATVNLFSNSSGENTFNFLIRGLAEAPEIQIAGHLPGQAFVNIADGDTSPREIDGTDFGDTNVTGSTAQREFLVINSGNIPLNIEGTTTITGPAAADFDISQLFAGNPFVDIDAGNSQTFIITFNPSTTGARNAIISIANNDPDEDPYTFAVTGVGIGEPDLRVRGRRNTFGNFLTEIFDNDVTPRSTDGTLFNDTEVGETTEMLVELSNDGDGALDFTATPSITGPDADQFSFVGLNTSDLLPGDERTFVIRFAPTSFGTKNATINLFTNSPGEATFNFSIQGPAEAPEIEIRGGGSGFSFPIADGDSTPRNEDGTLFGELNPNQGTLTVPFQIRNTGNSLLVINNATVTGTHAGDFTVRPVSGGFYNLLIPQGEEIIFEVAFDPSTTGTRNAIINIFTNDFDEDLYTFAVRGIGQDPGLVPEIEVTSVGGVPIANGDTSPRTSDGTDLGTLTIGGATVTRTFNILNEGDADLEINALVVNNTLYTNTTPTTIAPDQSRTFTITFDPSEAGIQNGTVSIFTNDPTSSSYTFAITAEVLETEENLAVTGFEINGRNANITFTSNPGETYSIQMNTTLIPSDWDTVPGFGNISGSSSPQSFQLSDVIAPETNPRAFFRLQRNP